MGDIHLRRLKGCLQAEFYYKDISGMKFPPFFGQLVKMVSDG